MDANRAHEQVRIDQPPGSQLVVRASIRQQILTKHLDVTPTATLALSVAAPALDWISAVESSKAVLHA